MIYPDGESGQGIDIGKEPRAAFSVVDEVAAYTAAKQPGYDVLTEIPAERDCGPRDPGANRKRQAGTLANSSGARVTIGSEADNLATAISRDGHGPRYEQYVWDADQCERDLFDSGFDERVGLGCVWFNCRQSTPQAVQSVMIDEDLGWGGGGLALGRDR